MAIIWAYSLDGDKSLIQDFDPGITADTIAVQTNGTAGAYTPKKGDIVSLNDQGRVCLAKEGTISAKQYLEATAVLGVCEGGTFLGLAQGGVYAATTVTNNSQTAGPAKVHTSTTDVYAVDLMAAAAAPVRGTAYALMIDAVNGAQVDTANPAGSTAIFRVVEYDANFNKVFGVFTALELIN